MEYASTQIQLSPAPQAAGRLAADPVPVRRRRPSSGPHLVEFEMRIGPYRLLGELGQGGFGTVWHGIDDATGREVAIKVLRSEYVTHPEIVARFQREARVVAMLEHPCIVDLIGFGELDDGTPYIVMEYLVGVSLYTHLRRRRVLPPEEILDIVEQLCDALAAAHRCGVIHRDIKASNVMLCDRPDGSRRVVLLDFGIAKLLEGCEPPITAPLATVGSPHFMAPEQIYGQEVDGRTDVYGLGILAFELLTGELPFQGDRCAVMHSHIEDERPVPSEYDESLRAFDAVFQRAMALHPSHRYADVDALLAGFRAALATHQGSSPHIAAQIRDVRAIGVYVQTELIASAAAEVADDSARTACESAAMDDVDGVATRAARFLARRGFVAGYEYGNVSLFVLPITGDEVIARQKALAVAGALRVHLARRPGAHDWVAIGIHVDIGAVSVCGDREVIGGPLLDNPPPPFSRRRKLSLTVSPALQYAG